MKRSKFTEEQIVLSCGISSATLWAWEGKFDCMELSDAKRLKTRERRQPAETCVTE